MRPVSGVGAFNITPLSSVLPSSSTYIRVREGFIIVVNCKVKFIRMFCAWLDDAYVLLTLQFTSSEVPVSEFQVSTIIVQKHWCLDCIPRRIHYRQKLSSNPTEKFPTRHPHSKAQIHRKHLHSELRPATEFTGYQNMPCN